MQSLPELSAPLVLATSEPFYAISCWYRDFDQVSDEEVSTLLLMSQQNHG
ncbi:hypothetical protein [Photobacterium sp. TY1-4]|nr:hypothetical protein [Photobacterium sp. TY1-4]UXI03352.1 hypothetical protein NH461_23290 [Photobacterium sp. TY1-4]